MQEEEKEETGPKTDWKVIFKDNTESWKKYVKEDKYREGRERYTFKEMNKEETKKYIWRRKKKFH